MKRASTVSFAAAGLLCGLVTLCQGPVQSQGKRAIQIRGSDTMVELTWALAERYKAADINVAGGGSGVGISALFAGKVDIANCVRTFTDKEIEEAKKISGKEPKLHAIGYQALAIYVHKENPLEEISLDQLKELYRRGGKFSSWSQLGVKVPGCESDKVVLVSRQLRLGVYEYFTELVLGKDGWYKPETIEESVPQDLVALVGKTPCAIGYGSTGYKTDAVKCLKVKGKEGKGVAPSPEAVYGRTYPISRPLFMCTVGEATGAVKDYIDWVRSDAGQAIVEKMGYVPLKREDRVKGK